MELPAIRIECQGATTVTLDELTDLQGNLKDLSDANYLKLKNSIVEYGFSFPIFMWQDNEGKKWIIDAHQRIRALRKMRSEGYPVPPLPADFIHAKDKIEAKKKLLLHNSRYGKISREGYDEFIDDPDAPILEDDINDLLEIPEVQLWDGSPSSSEEQPTDTVNPEKTREITCPNCSHKFNLFDKSEQIS